MSAPEEEGALDPGACATTEAYRWVERHLGECVHDDKQVVAGECPPRSHKKCAISNPIPDTVFFGLSSIGFWLIAEAP
jgi:hypothetical protein